jgi:hypothetical protein
MSVDETTPKEKCELEQSITENCITENCTLELGTEGDVSLQIHSRLDGIENVIKDLKYLLEFIHKERTSPRGRIDAMMTNTQHILDNIIQIQNDVKQLNDKMSQLEMEVVELKGLHFDVINLTDEFTKLRVDIAHLTER